MAHKGHSDCPYTSKAKCEKARREAIGPCIALLDDGQRECPHLGTDTVDGKAYCGQHVEGPYRAAKERERKQLLIDAMNQRIDAYLERTGQVAHECGDHCRFSSLHVSRVLQPQPRPEDLHWTSEALAIDMVTGITVRETDSGYEEVMQ